jgi:hypothetical protein
MPVEDIKVVGLSSQKTKAKVDGKIVGAIIGIIVLALGLIAGIFLVRQQQDIREKAAGNCDSPSSIVQCPRSDGALVSCNPPDQNGNAQISLCNTAGRIEVCDGVNYCCPQPGGNWTTNMAACAVTATPTATTSSQALTLSGTPACRQINFAWNNVVGAKGYYVDLSDSSTFTTIKSSGRLNADVRNFGFTELDNSKKYYARLTLADITNFPQYVYSGEISTPTNCPTSAVGKPTVTTSCSTGKPVATISWNGAAADFGYWIDVSTSSSFNTFYNKQVKSGSTSDSNNFHLFAGVGVDNTNAQLLVLDQNTKYYTRVFNSFESEVVEWTTCSVSSSNATATATSTTMSASKTATPTTTSTSRATSTATSLSKTATPTVKATISSSGTPMPIPETGADLPTIFGLSFGVVMILISLGLAL